MALIELRKKDLKRIKGMHLTLRELRIIDLLRDYQVIRNRYFDDRLPEVALVSVQIVPDKYLVLQDDEVPLAMICQFGYSLSKPIIIQIRQDSKPCEVRMSLIHEMAHASVNCKWGRDMKHGKKWQDEMKRLAEVGAFEDWW